ncbi:hypothetical protein Bca4012_018562 [Brassica carinata]|uniref:Uncharacterized protein n=1 Tax=Brassica carinata TaxID=52824 RepID=A0A8X8BEV1_BRACI|nr:hypothetical protein Bca52824_003048 [Brassica carinata]
MSSYSPQNHQAKASSTNLSRRRLASFQSVTTFFPYDHASSFGSSVPTPRAAMLCSDSGEKKDRSTPSRSSPPPRLKSPWSSYPPQSKLQASMRAPKSSSLPLCSAPPLRTPANHT